MTERSARSCSLGADVLDDFPDRTLARAALDAAPFIVSVGAFLTESAEQADVFLPTTVWGEQAGTTTNLEGRVLRLGQKVSPDGTPMPGWRIAAELATRFGADWDLEIVEEVQDEIARVAPGFAGVDANLIRRAVDGVVLPKADHEDAIALTPLRLPVTNASWEPIVPAALDPAAAAPSGEAEAEADADEVGAPVDSTESAEPVAPAVHVWNGAVESAAVPARDAYALRLVAGRLLYDEGSTVTESPSLSPLAPGSVLLLHRSDRERIGVDDGGEVRVTTTRGSLTIAGPRRRRDPSRCRLPRVQPGRCTAPAT